MTEITKKEAVAFIHKTLGSIVHRDLLIQNDGQQKLMQMGLAVAVVTDLIKPDLVKWSKDYDASRVLDAVAELSPESSIAIEWTKLKDTGLKTTGRPRGRGAVHGRNFLVVHLVNFLVEQGMHATRNKASDHQESACDVVVEAMKMYGILIDYDGARNAWEKRGELLGTR